MKVILQCICKNNKRKRIRGVNSTKRLHFVQFLGKKHRIKVLLKISPKPEEEGSFLNTASLWHPSQTRAVQERKPETNIPRNLDPESSPQWNSSRSNSTAPWEGFHTLTFAPGMPGCISAHLRCRNRTLFISYSSGGWSPVSRCHLIGAFLLWYLLAEAGGWEEVKGRESRGWAHLAERTPSQGDSTNCSLGQSHHGLIFS